MAGREGERERERERAHTKVRGFYDATFRGGRQQEPAVGLQGEADADRRGRRLLLLRPSKSKSPSRNQTLGSIGCGV